jgi:hypothetical protein
VKITDIGTVIATRELDLGAKSRVSIVIGKPEAFSDGTGYYCPFRIVGMGDGLVRHAGGEDSVQALELALKKIGATLYSSSEARSGLLTWACANVAGDLGFPVPDSIRDLAPP